MDTTKRYKGTANMAAKSSETIRASALDHLANNVAHRPQRERVEYTPTANCYVCLTTVTKDNKIDSEKIVDTQANGTMNWMRKHLLWASSHGMMVEITTATETEVAEYVASGAERLQQQYRTGTSA